MNDLCGDPTIQGRVGKDANPSEFNDVHIDCNRGDCDHDLVDERYGDSAQSAECPTKDAFRFKRVFETQSLSCGKIFSYGTSCKLNPKTS